MKFAVMGAGAVGCYYGGMLARAGHEVVLIARPKHVQAITEHGLLMDTQTFSEYVRLQATSDVASVRTAQCVLLCVKSTDTAQAASAMAPFLAPDAVVLSLQNGVDNAERAGELLKQPVLATVVYVAAEMLGPGHLKHHGRGELVIGPSAQSAALVPVFEAAGMPMQISDNVAGALWNKLIINCAYNAMSAITQLPYGRLVNGPGIENVMRDAVNETMGVAQAAGVVLPGDVWVTVQGIARSMANQNSSTAQDLASGRPSEIDYLNGHVVRLGERHGLATPVNRALQVLVKTLEAKRDQVI